MERVVTINLNGNPFQLEEPAYDALRGYLSRAEAALANNPDKTEIIRDLEQAIADKCGGYLGPHKSVVSAGEMTRILEEMGPVEGEAPEGAAPREEPRYEGPNKRLYRIRDGAKIAGVCTGLGAYFDLDPNIIRILFVLATIFMGGLGILVYIVMMFAVPSAHTSEEWAAAHGVPFNAQEIIDRAKREYGKFEENAARGWRARAWRGGASGHREPPPAPAAPVKPVGYAERMFAGLFALVFSVITAALLIAFLIVFFSLLSSGQVFGWTPPDGAPLWLVLVVIAIAYAAISSPFSGLRRASYATLSGRRDNGGGDGFATLAIAGLAAWFAWAYIPEARHMMEEAYVVVRDLVTYWNRHWDWNWN